MTVLTGSPIYLDGLLLSGRNDVSGLEIVTEDVAGWGSPSSSVQFYKRPRQHGSWSGEAFLDPRTIVLQGYIAALNADTLRQGKDSLIAACALDEVTLSITEGGLARTCTVRRQDELLISDTSDTSAQWSMQVVADDPRRYGPPSSPTTLLATTTGGLTYPITYPVTYTGVTATGIISINNTGNIDGPVVLRIDGPVTDPIVQQQIGTEVVTFAMTYGLASGNWITIDFENEEVLENDQASRDPYVTQRGYMSLMPGVNQFVFTSGTYSSTAMLTVTTSPSWM